MKDLKLKQAESDQMYNVYKLKCHKEGRAEVK
jgi:hypothetical protein